MWAGLVSDGSEWAHDVVVTSLAIDAEFTIFGEELQLLYIKKKAFLAGELQNQTSVDRVQQQRSTLHLRQVKVLDCAGSGRRFTLMKGWRVLMW